MNDDICTAILSWHRMWINFEKRSLIVEPHLYGIASSGEHILLAWKVADGATHSLLEGWELIRLNETRGLRFLAERFEGPRKGHTQSHKAFSQIYATV